jgi:hypothetical protein
MSAIDVNELCDGLCTEELFIHVVTFQWSCFRVLVTSEDAQQFGQLLIMVI